MDQLTPQGEHDLASISGIVKEIDGSRIMLTTADGEILADVSAIQDQFDDVNIFDRVELLGETIGDAFQASQLAGSAKEPSDVSASDQDAAAPSPAKMPGTR